MFTRFDSDDPESIHKFLQENAPNAAKDDVRKAMVFGWCASSEGHERTEDILEREMRRLVDDAIREFREDRDRFLSPKDSFSDPTNSFGAILILKIGQDRFGVPNEWIRQSLMTTTQGERLRYLLEKVHYASSWDDLMAEG